MSHSTDRNISKAYFLGHSCILIHTSSNKKILIDPFLAQNPRCPVNFSQNPLTDIDYIVLTHGHSDHTADAISTAKASSATVVATYELALLVQKFSEDKFEVIPMNKGGTVELDDSNIKVTLTHAFHSSSFDAPDGQTYYAGEACGAIITIDENKNIYHAGDTCFFNDMKYIKEKYSPEIGFIPIGDCFTMGPEEAALASMTLGLSRAVPIHWGTFPVLTGSPEQFNKSCNKVGVEAILLSPGESIEV